MAERKKILVIGAGRSSAALVRYLSKHSSENQWDIHVLDRAQEAAQLCCAGMDNCFPKAINALDEKERREELRGSDIVISMLPARFHIMVAKDCLDMGINLITPSYVSEDMKAMASEVESKGLLFLNEMGLDPGIDHMSALKIIDHIKSEGGKLLSFKSFTGGLVAPESDDNPWNYKFTWNPRNVVLAGQGGASQFIRKGKYKYIPYNRLFNRVEDIHIEGYGAFEGYANRNSLQYREIYGLEDIPTIYRGTLRRKGYSEAWNVFVQLGLTDDTYQIEDSANMSYREFINSYLRYEETTSVEDKLCDTLGLDPNGLIMTKLKWLGIFEDEKIGLDKATPAQILQKILVGKWSLKEDDKDMIAMYHHFEYEMNGELKKLSSSMISIGEDPTYTGMARTVGLPIAIAVKLILLNKVDLKGVLVPTMPELYLPILKELEEMGIRFDEQEEN